MIDYPSPELNLISGPNSIAAVALAFLIHHFTMASDGFERWIKARFPDPAASIRKVMIRRLLTVALGSVFFGFGLCLLSLYFGSIWAALFVHISMAISHEWFSLSLHPGMSLAGKNRVK